MSRFSSYRPTLITQQEAIRHLDSGGKVRHRDAEFGFVVKENGEYIYKRPKAGVSYPSIEIKDPDSMWKIVE